MVCENIQEIESKSAIIGAIDNYSIDKILPWVKSIRETNFTGDICLLVYRASESVINELKLLGIKLYSCTNDENGNPIIHNQMGRDTVCHQMRFLHLCTLLSQSNYKYVIFTDVRDVIFQCNPFPTLVNLLEDKDIIAPSEGILYKNEPWNQSNVHAAFGNLVNDLQEQDVYNVGTIAGTLRGITELAERIYTLGKNRQIPNDQAVFNLLIDGNRKLNESIFKELPMHSGWACQCGTVLDPDKISLVLNESRPIIIDHEVYTPTMDARKFIILHQWDRVPSLSEYIKEKYK